MTKNATKTDLREGLPGHGEGTPTYDGDVLEESEDTHVAREPEVVSPGVGKNVPSGQTTKG
jgi:hypothetical protein